MARLAKRPWQDGDPIPETGSIVLVSGANSDISCDQDRGYLERAVLGYSPDKQFIILQTGTCWPTVERLTNCWFGDVRQQRIQELMQLLAAADEGSDDLDMALWKIVYTPKADEEFRPFTTSYDDAVWLVYYVFPPSAGEVRRMILESAFEKASQKLWEDPKGYKPGYVFTSRMALEVCDRLLTALVESKGYIREGLSCAN